MNMSRQQKSTKSLMTAPASFTNDCVRPSACTPLSTQRWLKTSLCQPDPREHKVKLAKLQGFAVMNIS
jgi:hypothetical protein